jgi:hypothetical protein
MYMDSVRMIVTLPRLLKAKLDAKRREGYTASGYVRRLLEKDLLSEEEGVPRGGVSRRREGGAMGTVTKGTRHGRQAA